MSDTTYIDYVQPAVSAEWLNEINDHVWHDTPVNGATVHMASTIAVTPFDDIAATDVQAALNEINDKIPPSDPIDASEVSYTPEGTGAVTTTVQSKLRDVVNAKNYGFDVSGTANTNRDAVLAAHAIANGRPVVIDAPTDFAMSALTFSNTALNLVFQGTGRVLKTSGTSHVLNIANQYTAVQEVSAFNIVSLVIDGSSATVTRLAVADTSAYQRGDVVRVVSDDEDPAAAKVNRRRGESAVVAEVDVSFIYLAGRLEDFGLYLTNPRVGKISTLPVEIVGLKVLSHFEHTSGLFSLSGLYKPKIEIQVENHGQIAINANGCYHGEWYVSGSGKGDSSGSLGYLVNDISGEGNVFVRPFGKFWRHVLTTNHNDVDAGSESIHRFGATRNHTVLYGVAESSQGTPWDEHEGARRSVWVGCSAKSNIWNSRTSNTAFQARGKNARIVNPTVDETYDACLLIGATASGKIVVDGGNIATLPISAVYELNNLDCVELNNVECSVRTAQWLLSSDVPIDVYVNGGRYGYTALSATAAQIVNAFGGTRWFLNNPEFFVDGNPAVSPTGFRFVRMSSSGTGAPAVYGNFKARRKSNVSVAHITRSENAAAIALLKVLWIGGTFPPITTGTFALNKYTVQDINTPTNSTHNLVDLADYLTKIAYF